MDWTMTEVKSTTTYGGGGGSGLGVFATRVYTVGDVIFEEDIPLMILKADMSSLLVPNRRQEVGHPNQNDHDDDLNNNTDDDHTESIVPPSSIPSYQVGTFQGMVQAGLAYVQQQQQQQQQQEETKTNSKKKLLLELYRPPTDGSACATAEQEILKVAQEALLYLKETIPEKSSAKTFVTNHENDQELLQVMLIWTCNSFEGGRIYQYASRINHSCNPNAIVAVVPASASASAAAAAAAAENNDGQLIRAATSINVGEEITISYMGLLLYADRPTRQRQLQRTKHFICTCARCVSSSSSSSLPDIAGAIPCPSCHPRQGRYLDEDVQYDDDGTVHYAIPRQCTTTTNSSSANEAAVSSLTLSLECTHCHGVITLDQKGSSTDPNHVIRLTQGISEKVATFLVQHQQQQQQNEESELQQQLLQLSSSVVGAKHWTTNLLLLLSLDQQLQEMHSKMMMLSSTGSSLTLPDDDISQEVVLAECIDSLQRVESFVCSQDLRLHMGHVLSTVMIGIARTLVTLGDSKSKRYASEWMDKILQHVHVFESPAMIKVVNSLHTAWQKTNSDNRNKRAKLV